MNKPVVPHFLIKNRFQKSNGTYEQLLRPDVLADIAHRLTGRRDYTVEFDDSGYNKGRLAVLRYRATTFYVSIAETDVTSRNASFQSLPTALSHYILDKSRKKKIVYYIHPDTRGKIATGYFLFMYRLMRTVGVVMPNLADWVDAPIEPFATPREIIAARDALKEKNTTNRSTYITRGEDGAVQIYGKTYGANKYETTLICLAVARIVDTAVEVYEVAEGGLQRLPELARNAIRASGNVVFRVSTPQSEMLEYRTNNSLRSIKFTYNLLDKFKKKACAFCDCEIEQIIHGAHVWPVAAIKKATQLTADEQLAHALDRDNGLWLCQNHHKLFDSDILYVTGHGVLRHRTALAASDAAFIQRNTTVKALAKATVTPSFAAYLARRNVAIVAANYVDL